MRNIFPKTIIIIIAMRIVVLYSLPGIIFFACLITDDGGKLDNAEKISEMVIENQETLQEIVSQILSHEQEFRIVIDVEDKSYLNLDSSKEEKNETLELEDIYRLSEELDIQEVHAYKNPEMSMVVFTTYQDGIVSSGTIKGFFYLEQDLTESIFEYGCFQPYHIDSYSEIINNWYYFQMSC